MSLSRTHAGSPMSQLHLLTSPKGRSQPSPPRALKGPIPARSVAAGMGNFITSLHFGPRTLTSPRFIALWKPAMGIVYCCYGSFTWGQNNTHPGLRHFQIGHGHSDGKWRRLIMLFITTNQDVSFTDICAVHGELSNMNKLLQIWLKSISALFHHQVEYNQA